MHERAVAGRLGDAQMELAVGEQRLAARAELPASENGSRANELQAAFSAWDRGEPDEALEQLQEVLAAEQDPDRKDLLRRVMVAIFTELGADHPLARQHRRRLAAALN